MFQITFHPAGLCLTAPRARLPLSVARPGAGQTFSASLGTQRCVGSRFWYCSAPAAPTSPTPVPTFPTPPPHPHDVCRIWPSPTPVPMSPCAGASPWPGTRRSKNPKTTELKRKRGPSGFIVSSKVFSALLAGTRLFIKRLRRDSTWSLDWAGRRREQRWVWQESGTKRVKTSGRQGLAQPLPFCLGPLGLPSKGHFFIEASAVPPQYQDPSPQTCVPCP